MSNGFTRLFESRSQQLPRIFDGFTWRIFINQRQMLAAGFTIPSAKAGPGDSAIYKIWVIPTCIDHDLRAHLRRPMVMMRHG